jgi:hypothetical protein
VFGEFEGSGERVWVTQSPTFASGPSTVGARTGVCFGHVEGDVGTYFVGIPQRTAPVFIGAADARLTAVPATSEFFRCNVLIRGVLTLSVAPGLGACGDAAEGQRACVTMTQALVGGFTDAGTSAIGARA